MKPKEEDKMKGRMRNSASLDHSGVARSDSKISAKALYGKRCVYTF